MVAHRNYKHAAPLALKPLQTQAVNYAQASTKRRLWAGNTVTNIKLTSQEVS